jgi:hypothetical protein
MPQTFASDPSVALPTPSNNSQVVWLIISGNHCQQNHEWIARSKFTLQEERNNGKKTFSDGKITKLPCPFESRVISAIESYLL